MVEDSEDSVDSEQEDIEELKEGDTNVKDTENKRKKKTKEQIEKEALELGDLYGLLQIDVDASEKQVTTAFRKASLKYHPDKLKREPTEDDKKHWLLVQKAYETLQDPIKRKKYDSSLPFDEKIPDKDLDEDEFYSFIRRVLRLPFDTISDGNIVRNLN